MSIEPTFGSEASRHLFQLLESAALEVGREGRNDDELVRLVRRGFSAALEAGRTAVDQSANPTAALERIDGGWTSVLDALKYRGEDQPEAMESLTRFRELHRVALAAWILHRIRGREPRPELGTAYRFLLSPFQSGEELAAATERAIEAGWNERSPVVDWLLNELPTGRAHFIDDDGLLLRSLVVGLLLRGPEQDRLGALDVLRGRLDETERSLEMVRQETALWRALGATEPLPTTVERVRQLLHEAVEAAEERERQRIRETDVDVALVGKFKAALAASWLSHRLAFNLFERFGAASVTPHDLDDDVPWFGTDDWLPKAIFVREGGWAGLEMNAAEYGRGIAASEMRELVETVFRGAPAVASIDEGWLAAEMSSMREDGREPSLLVMPVDWRLSTSLFPRRPWRGHGEEAEWLPQEARHWYHGTVDGVTLIEWPSVPDRTVALVDPMGFARIRQQEVDAPGRLIRIRVGFHDAEEALRVAQENPEIFANVDEADDGARADEIAEKALVHVRERFAIDVLDSSAARVVRFVEME